MYFGVAFQYSNIFQCLRRVGGGGGSYVSS